MDTEQGQPSSAGHRTTGLTRRPQGLGQVPHTAFCPGIMKGRALSCAPIPHCSPLLYVIALPAEADLNGRLEDIMSPSGHELQLPAAPAACPAPPRRAGACACACAVAGGRVKCDSSSPRALAPGSLFFSLLPGRGLREQTPVQGKRPRPLTAFPAFFGGPYSRVQGWCACAAERSHPLPFP